MFNLKIFITLFLVCSNILVIADNDIGDCFSFIKNNQCLGAIKICEVYAEKGHAEAQTALGLLLSGINYGDFRKNYKQSFYWISQAAAQNYTKAELTIAEMYMGGEVVPMNAKKAKNWYEKAAEKGNLDAVNGLARLYRYGTGVRKDYEKAFQLYEQAAIENHTRSQVGLGLSYRDGKGIKKNLVNAYAWLSIAAEKIDDQTYRAMEKQYKDERETLDRAKPQCKHLLTLDQMGERFAIGYARQMILDLKQRMGIKQINKAKKLALEIKKERAFTRSDF